MKRSRSGKHARSTKRIASDATEAFQDYPNRGSGSRKDGDIVGNEETVSVSSISALGPEMRSQTTSAFFNQHHPHADSEGHRSSLSAGSSSQRRSTAILESAHPSRDDEDDNGQGPLRIDKDETDAIGSKRGRNADGKAEQPTAAPPQRRRLDSSIHDRPARGLAERDRDHEDCRQEPTPRPKRPTTLLTATPAFIRDEKRQREENQRGRLAVAEPAAASSPLARGFSNLRESFSLLMGTPALHPASRPPRHPHVRQQSQTAMPSPWDLSSIKPGSPRPSLGSMGATVRRGGSDFAINLWPDEASHGHSSASSLASSLQRNSVGSPHGDDRLQFLRPSRELAAANGGRGTRSATTGGAAAHHGSGSDKENSHLAGTGAAAAGAVSTLPPPTGVGARHAAPSTISENLLDIISSSSGSRIRSEHGGSLKQQQQQRLPSVASTIMEPDVSPIMKTKEEERNRRPPYVASTATGGALAAKQSRTHERLAAVSAESRRPRFQGDPRRFEVPIHTVTAAAAAAPNPTDHYANSRLGGAAASRVLSRYDYVAGVTEEELMRERDDEDADGEGVAASSPAHYHDDRCRQPRARPRSLAATTRKIGAACTAMFLVVWMLACTLPLLAATTFPLQPWPHRGDADEALAVFYVNPVAELHALYQIPASSLVYEEEVQRLYHRVLGEGIERLEKAAAPLSPLQDPQTTHNQRILFLRQMLVAYEAVRRRSSQYARSRDRSAWRRFVSYPAQDVWRYAVARREMVAGGDGSRQGKWLLSHWLKRPSISAFLDRVVTAIACLDANGGASDLALVPLCPSLRFREEAMVTAAKDYLYHDVNAQFDPSQKQWRAEVLAARLQRDWDSEVYVETLLQFIRRDSLNGIRSYNTW